MYGNLAKATLSKLHVVDIKDSEKAHVSKGLNRNRRTLQGYKLKQNEPELQYQTVIFRLEKLVEGEQYSLRIFAIIAQTFNAAASNLVYIGEIRHPMMASGVKAIDFYLNQLKIVVTCSDAILRINEKFEVEDGVDGDRVVDAKSMNSVMRNLTASKVFEYAGSDYRLCGMENGNLVVLAGDDVYAWGEQ